MTAACVKPDCDRDAEVRVDFGPYVIDVDEPLPMCRHHAGFECRTHMEAETVPLGGESE
jgi:hypothetical protein